MECLVSASGVWKFPKMLIIDGVESGASATEFNLGFGEVVLEMTGLEFVHPKTQAGAHARRMQRLGSSIFTPLHLLPCLDAELWLAQRDEDEAAHNVIARQPEVGALEARLAARGRLGHEEGVDVELDGDGRQRLAVPEHLGR